MSTYIGVSHQYKVERSGRHDMTVYVQNLGAEEAPRPGEQVTCSPGSPSTRSRWLPQDGLSMEEEDE